MTTRRNLPAGFVVPAQPIEQHQPPAGGNWVHEIKHDGYRLIVRKEGAGVRLVYAQRLRLDRALPDNRSRSRGNSSRH